MTKRFTRRTPPLLALGTIAAGGLALSACGDDAPEDYLFASTEQCAASGIDRGICEAEYQAALSDHLRDAPRFDAMAVCEAEYGPGRCMEQPRPEGGGSFFLPFMTGYLISSAISNLTSYNSYGTYVSSGSYRRPAAIYTDRSGTTYRSDPPQAGEPPRPRPANVNTRTVSRQGFGGSSSGRTSSGG